MTHNDNNFFLFHFLQNDYKPLGSIFIQGRSWFIEKKNIRISKQSLS